MGIRGLFSFAESNKKCDFFENHRLKSTKLVIDGNNLRFFLHKRTKNCAYGGEYEIYHQKVTHFFQALLKMNIEPVVVIDGSFEEGKKKTLWKRTQEQLEVALICDPKIQSRYSVMPIFAKDIFIQAIKSLKIQVLQTYGEADRFMAHLASKVLKCPVLSNDSDFIIFSSVELILLSSVFLENTTEDGISCKKFQRSKFLKFYGLENDQILPLCASLLGTIHKPHGQYFKLYPFLIICSIFGPFFVHIWSNFGSFLGHFRSTFLFHF